MCGESRLPAEPPARRDPPVANAAILYRPRIRGVFVRYEPTTIDHRESPVSACRRGERRL